MNKRKQQLWASSTNWPNNRKPYAVSMAAGTIIEINSFDIAKNRNRDFDEDTINFFVVSSSDNRLVDNKHGKQGFRKGVSIRISIDVLNQLPIDYQ